MTMDKAKGKTQQITGKGKEKAGEATGNEKMQDEGMGDQVEGKGREIVGKGKDLGKKIKDKVT